MIRVDQTLCDCCGICVDSCPVGAIALSDGVALVDTDLCNGCRVCADVCPNQALTWVEAELESETATSQLAVIKAPAQVIRVATKEPVPWRRAVVPAVGSALSWIGREVMPRLAPFALDALDEALGRRLSHSSRAEGIRPISSTDECGEGKQRRHRHRQGRSRQ
jgi:NAD-dependent dihydropyrimidine dehydrogenase PreA subunit